MPTTTVVKMSQYIDETTHEPVESGLSEADNKLLQKRLAVVLEPFVAKLQKRVVRPQCVTLTIEMET